MPLAADTNVLARALTDDGSDQSRRAVECFRANEIFVPDTVLLETEWLLRSRLGLNRDQVNGLFWTLLSSPQVVQREAAAILASYGKGSGHVFNLGHGISQHTPPENVAALIKTVRAVSVAYH